MKKYRCPWCGQYTISFWERIRVDYRFWGKCQECGEKWKFSNRALLILLPWLILVIAVGVSPIWIWLRVVIVSCLYAINCVLQATFIPIVKKE